MLTPAPYAKRIQKVLGASAVRARLEREADRATCGVAAFARAGFTLIELLVVMAIIAMLLTIAVPRYWNSTEKAKEAVLKQDLATMRGAIDQYHADRGKYPDSIEELVEKKYLKAIPRDPVTESAQTWIVVPPPDAASGSLYDIRSGAAGSARDGRSYSEW